MKGATIVKEIQIRNFRSLKDTGLQTLSPITLLVGENSSGKSTFLRAFPLLKQSISKRTSGPILWAGDVDDYVDFGSFEETVTNDGSETIVFRFRFDTNDVETIRRRLLIENLTSNETADLDGPLAIDYEITIETFKGSGFVSKLRLAINTTTIEFDLLKDSLCLNEDFFYQCGSSKSKKGSSTRSSHESLGYIGAISKSFSFALPSIDELIDELMDCLDFSDQNNYNRFLWSEVLAHIGERLAKNCNLSKIDSDPDDASGTPKWYISDYNNLIQLLQSGEHDRLSQIIKLFYIYRAFPGIDDYIYAYFKQVHYIAPLRATAERYYRLRNLAVDEVDYQGKNLAIFINSLPPKQLREFQEWTNTHFGFTVKTGKSKGHLSLMINIHNSEKSFNLSDTGFGYSQVLPIITQLWELSSQKGSRSSKFHGANQRQPLVVAIEQPELHLHPAVQAKLAKAFIACIKLARENGYELQLILETHSQTIVDYLGRAIAKGILPHNDVSVILFEKQYDDNTTTVKNSSYDEDGYLKNWPYGFFEAEE